MKSKILLPTLMLILASCSSGPEYAAKQFTENLAKGNITEAKKYATESTGRLIDLASSFGDLPTDPGFTFKAERDSIVGNKAWVFYRDSDGKQHVIQLVKIDGKWLVQMKKDR